MFKIYFGIFFIIVLNISQAQDYFQQQVKYKISAELIPETKILKVNSLMEYTNNSNDELKEVYLRLNWNIFSKNSYARQIQKEKKVYYKDFTKEVEIKKFSLSQGGLVQTNYTLDNTILKVQLPSPLRKGEKLTLEMSIEEEVPKEGMRMGYKDRNFSIAHFHPSICVYDKFGWHTDQYLGLGEFYEEYGEYEVEITLPKSYLVFYTGTLINPDEVYPKSIIDNLNKAKSSEQKVRVIDQTVNSLKKDDEQKQTWKIFAKDVRTFAFASFENYKWDVQNWDGILIHNVYPEELEDYYSEEGMKASVHAIKFFSQNFGRYIYPQMFVTVGGSGGGMEYPGIIFMGRSLGGGLLTKITSEVVIHEIGHSWYPMMINSNEIDFAFQDEGFNVFITTLAVEDLYGRKDNYLNLSGILKALVYNIDVRSDNQANTINWSINDYEEPITTHSDRYASENAYQVNSYPKTASILFMLQYVMGDSAFADLMMEYYKRFLLKHVYPEDFFNLAMEINYKWNGKRDLRWFFDQCFNKNYKLDYALNKLDYELVDDKYLTTIIVERKEQMMMPVDVVVELENGENKQVWFEVEAFMNGSSQVTKTFSFDSRPLRAEINPDGRLIDINRLNNSTDLLPPIYFHFNPQFNLFGDPFNYRILWSPTMGFNNIDGMKLGLNFNGSYIGDRYGFDIYLAQGTKISKNSFGFEATLFHRLDFLGRLAFGSFTFFNYEGRRGGKFEVTKTFAKYIDRNPKFNFRLTASYFDAYNDDYFESFAFDEVVYDNVSISPLSFIKNYRQRKYYSVNGIIQYQNNGEFWGVINYVRFESGILRREGSYGILQDKKFNTLPDQTIKNIPFQKLDISFRQKLTTIILLDLTFREYVGYSPNDLPVAKSFYLSTVNPIEEFRSFIYRTEGIISKSFRQKHSIPNGGGYLRGYYNQNIFGNNVTAFNLEMDFSNWVKIIPAIGTVVALFHPSFFFDAGNVWYRINDFTTKKLLTDYGFSIGISPKLSVSGTNIPSPLDKIGIEEVRFDFPIYVSHPIDGEKKLKFRWLIGFQSPMN